MGSHIQKPGLIQCGGSVVCPSRAFEMSTVYIFVQPSTSLSSCYLSYLGQDEEANGGHEQKRWHQMSPDARCSNTCTLLLCKVTHPPNCVAIVKRAIVTPFYSNLKHTYQYHGETKCVGKKIQFSEKIGRGEEFTGPKLFYLKLTQLTLLQSFDILLYFSLSQGILILLTCVIKLFTASNL